jgi:uncharacterized membrane protein YkoI
MYRNSFALIAAIAFATAGSSALAKETPSPKLLKEAKVSEAAARSTALGKVPGGMVKSAELEKEKGQLIWSVDITKPGVSGATEINVSAITGKIVATEQESAMKEAAETAVKKVEMK